MDVTQGLCEYVGALGAICERPSEWTIATTEDPYDLLDACSQHVGELLVGGRLNYVCPRQPSDLSRSQRATPWVVNQGWPALREDSLVWRCRACGNDTRMDDVDCWEADGSCHCVSCTGAD